MRKTDNYPLFIHWYKTLDWILDKCEKMPKHVRFSLSGRIANYALDIQEGIVEAIYTKERKAILNGLNLSLEKLRILFRIAHDRKYISHKQHEFISLHLLEAGKMLGGWYKLSI